MITKHKLDANGILMITKHKLDANGILMITHHKLKVKTKDQGYSSLEGHIQPVDINVNFCMTLKLGRSFPAACN